MKATISPLPYPAERTVYLELTGDEARMLKSICARVSFKPYAGTMGKTVVEKFMYGLYSCISKVV